MNPYVRTTNPEEHIVQYRERIKIIPIPPHLNETCLYKGFRSTLIGSALKWILNVPPYFVTFVSHLVNLFDNQFSCNRIFSDLYRVVQDPKKPLMYFVTRFGMESLNIPNIDVATVIEAFKMGLKKDYPFYEDLVMTPCKGVDEVRSRALRFTRLEEEKETLTRTSMPSSYENPNYKA